MPNAKVSDEEFVAAWERHGSITAIAHALNMSPRNANQRRRTIEQRIGRPLVARLKQGGVMADPSHNPAMRELSISDGYVLVGSDAHYMPGVATTAHRAFVEFARELKPVAVVMN